MKKYSFCFVSFFFYFFFINYFFYNNMFYYSFFFMEWEIISFNSMKIAMTILLDWMSLLFMMFVSLFSSSLIYYSKSYMQSELNYY